jgi:hypothetical protein
LKIGTAFLKGRQPEHFDELFAQSRLIFTPTLRIAIAGEIVRSFDFRHTCSESCSR